MLRSATAESDYEFSPMSAVAPAAGSAAGSADDTLSPQSVYSRYIEAREAWYEKEALAPSARTDKAYRKAQKLEMRLSADIRRWCLGVTQMGNGFQWTDEAMLAWYDFDKVLVAEAEAKAEK
ncbi:hypothetical protein E4U19_007202 [Claviceps sp. Clav32 group G5]|nr:hypothetical protein E4U19_007202 [Claviceps sp. Clav32 group G5]